MNDTVTLSSIIIITRQSFIQSSNAIASIFFSSHAELLSSIPIHSLRSQNITSVSMLDGMEDIYWRGCLDKYDRFAKQKEWRVCWLPSELNYEAKILHVGSLEDIIDIVPTKDIRRYLLKKYSGYVPGIITNNRRTIAGTESYGAFKTRMRDIDGTGEFVVEIG